MFDVLVDLKVDSSCIKDAVKLIETAGRSLDRKNTGRNKFKRTNKNFILQVIYFLCAKNSNIT